MGRLPPYVCPYEVADVYAQLEDKDRVFGLRRKRTDSEVLWPYRHHSSMSKHVK
jgi:hypothetical protein